jgi:hypothetical protein
MWDQAKVKTLGPSEYFANNQGARVPPSGTVAVGHLDDDELMIKGTEGGKPTSRYPFPITKAVLLRGEDRYNIFCLPCHSKSGDGLGMIVQRGFKQPESFHIDRLRNAAPGYFYAVLTKGYRPANNLPNDPATKPGDPDDKVHPAISKKMEPSDRWSIIAYIHALQFSQNAPLDAVPADERARLTGSKEPANAR